MTNSVYTEKTCIGKAGEIDQIWEELSESVAQAFRMDGEEKSRFKAKNIARLIGTLPFIARCEDPHRTAVVHLGAYILSVRETKPCFNAAPADNGDLFERLRLISSFKDGDQAIIKKGMSLLALCMIEDYQRDTHLDSVLGKYNPVKEGAFDYPELRENLLKTIHGVESAEVDAILDAEVGPLAYWGW
jgi:hypothetical protein